MSIQIHPIQVLNKTSVRNQNKSVDIIENGTTEVKADKGYSGINKVTINVDVPSSGNLYTGHADAEGLKAIGWTDEDIAYYQEHGVNWNEEEDDSHKVPEANKDLYGVLTLNNISSYKNDIYYLPKIDTSNLTSLNKAFQALNYMVAIPVIDTSNVTDMSHAFTNCYSLKCVPPLNTSNVTIMDYTFSLCRSLTKAPILDTSKVTSMTGIYSDCTSLQDVPLLDTSVLNYKNSMFAGCYALRHINIVSANKAVLNVENVWGITGVYIKSNGGSIDLGYAARHLSKESLIYSINNSPGIAIRLVSKVYNRLANDPDVLQALENNPSAVLRSL